ncbi:3-ketoacyl-ACP reductase [Priestia flexa]|jgi:3-oxoacyl-[acyl-carrier protein] reductase|uniref:glucose 1-dehydrogenase [NAD(P)(+)] n=1 Tax=Priestia flexa TaxID=86664 RepID=A0A1N6W5N9_9BACI|nr:3-ketoacyl-ACP reductase [Priestia flexa]MBN8252549.1 3-ketoacyl-ACP reductase [Priestia flexa]MBN8434018.1 3-ketoacyl-ACP reductase [Priestia flexa]MBY6086242.1 3-ketoacyl-ACP reductase [Priestia flexa]MCA0966549.1 3-ketoacyl-ACP reductase [Priestia flexa]MCA1201616.1 3-ketoacyl-ACP reductase [Priestia flexa]
MGQSLQGKVAIITGAGKGIGRATALDLAKEGVNLGLLARTEADLQAVAQEVEALGVKVAYATADVSSMEEVNKAVDYLYNQLGKADILINNAGIGKFGGFLELSPEEWKQIIDINLMGVYYVTRAVLPQMIEKNGGDIINISSTAGQKGAPVTSAYSASKFGLLGLTESLALEVRKHNIRVTALTPSTVATELAYKENLTDGNPEKVMQPEDLAEIMVAQLKLHPRIFIKSAGMWSTNP